MRVILAASTLALLGACASVSIPAAGVASDGVQWSGYFDLSEFVLSGGNVICRGEPTMGLEKVNTHYFTCDNGRSGSVITTRTSMTGGVAEVTWDNGVTGNFTYGN